MPVSSPHAPRLAAAFCFVAVTWQCRRTAGGELEFVCMAAANGPPSRAGGSYPVRSLVQYNRFIIASCGDKIYMYDVVRRDAQPVSPFNLSLSIPGVSAARSSDEQPVWTLVKVLDPSPSPLRVQASSLPFPTNRHNNNVQCMMHLVHVRIGRRTL